MISPKNVLLINPWIYDFTAYDFWMKPLGLLYMASLVRRTGVCRLSFVDCMDRFHPLLEKPPKKRRDGRGPFPKEYVEKPGLLHNVPRRYSRYGIPVEAFLKELHRIPEPDVVLITCTMTYWYPGVQHVVEIIRRRFGAVPIVLGGAYATLCPSHARSQSGADIIVEGPGEHALLPALRKVLGDRFPCEQDGRIGLDALPPPAFDLLRDRTWLPLLTSRGCPERCTFCACSKLSPGFEQRSPESVAAEIAESFFAFGTRQFAFYDDALFLNKERHIVPLLKHIAAERRSFRFHTPNGLHVREIDQRLARLLWEAGVRTLYLSAESSDQEWIRKKTGKVRVGDLPRALDALERAGYRKEDINVFLIMGLPGQGTDRVRESIRFVSRLGARPRLAFFSPIPGTVEWEGLVREGHMKENSDPLLHNKVAFAYLKADFTGADFDAVNRILAEGQGKTRRTTDFPAGDLD